jgi:hypothetical protein
VGAPKEKIMAKKEGLEKQVPNNVVAIGSSSCVAEDCKKKSERAGFCGEHFDWFKAGLVGRDGHKASDFDKKFYHYEAAKRKKVA